MTEPRFNEPSRPAEDGEAREPDWYWEGYIHARVLEHLQAVEGFAILSPGQVVPAEQGVDIVAERPDAERSTHRFVTVRGWPSAHHTRGALAGQPRATRPEVIARGWIAQALLDLALGRGADPEVDLCLALPAMASYIRYLQRLRWFLTAAQVSVYLVSQEGRVSVTPAGAAPAGALAPSGEARGAGKRRKLGLPGATRLELPLLHELVVAGGEAGRAEMIPAVARWFPEAPQPLPAEFGARLSVAQRALQVKGLTELSGRGRWRLTASGRAAHDAQWEAWRATTDGDFRRLEAPPEP